MNTMVAELEQVLLSRQGQLKGKELGFLCPCHDDHHPSARWNPEKKVWHCFACGAGGGQKHLMEQLDLIPEHRSAKRKGHFHSTRNRLPHYALDWRRYSHELQLISEDRWLHGTAVLETAKGLDTSEWTEAEFDQACDAVCDAMLDLVESEAIDDLAFNLRAYGLEEEEREYRREHRR